MKHNSKKSARLLGIIAYGMFVFGIMLAPQTQGVVSAACGQDAVLGIPTWHKYLPSDDAGGKCTPRIRGATPEESVNPILSIALAVIEAAATIGAVVALVMVFWGSFNFVTSIGEGDKAASARKTVQNAGIGLIILLLSTRIVSFFGERIS